MYGLKQEHFSINPKEEFHVFFAREDEFDRFLQDLRATLDSGRVPRYVVFGLFGVGKTHFLLHLKYRIADKTEAVYLETPSAHRRTSFLDFYHTVISALGRGNVIDLLSSGIKKHTRLRELGLSEDIAHVVSKAMKDGEQFVLWKYLSGEKLKSTEADKLEAVRPALSAEDAVSVLKAVAALTERETGKPLLLLVDEFETTGNIGGDAKVGFTEAVRAMVDEGSKVGVIFALTSRGLAEMPSAIYEDQVRRRIGVTNYIPFQEYKEDELDRFMLQAIDYRRDKGFDTEKALAKLTTSETVTKDTFPFTQEALKEIVTSIILFKEQNKIEAVRPKEALDIMDKALRAAITAKRPIIEKDLVLSIRDQVVESLKL